MIPGRGMKQPLAGEIVYPAVLARVVVEAEVIDGEVVRVMQSEVLVIPQAFLESS